jgi:hypothetical protein
MMKRKLVQKRADGTRGCLEGDRVRCKKYKFWCYNLPNIAIWTVIIVIFLDAMGTDA